MTKISYFLFAIVILSSCRTGEKALPKELYFRDTVERIASILYDNNILQISTYNTEKDNVVGFCFGYYNRRQDTIFADCPAISSEDYNKIKTKYFWLELQPVKSFNGKDYVDDSAYIHEYFKEPIALADSLFHVKLPDSTVIVQVRFDKDTLLIRGNKLVHINKNR